MTTFAKDLDVPTEAAPVPPEESVDIDDNEVAATALLLTWNAFIPRIGTGELSTSVEMQRWRNMPEWQRHALRLQDPDIMAHNPEVVQRVRKKVAKMAWVATAGAEQRREAYYA
jgi:hypothetical protein